jgi:hypothetical protein
MMRAGRLIGRAVCFQVRPWRRLDLISFGRSVGSITAASLRDLPRLACEAGRRGRPNCDEKMTER